MAETPMTPNCPDCQAGIGEAHTEGCDVARCMAFGEQRLMHEMVGSRPKVVEEDGVLLPVFDPDGDHDCGRDVWSGEWPGVAEAREFGWWTQFRPAEGLGWVPCAADAPGAAPDLNRLYTHARWDATAARWRLRETTEDR